MRLRNGSTSSLLENGLVAAPVCAVHEPVDGPVAEPAHQLGIYTEWVVVHGRPDRVVDSGSTPGPEHASPTVAFRADRDQG